MICRMIEYIGIWESPSVWTNPKARLSGQEDLPEVVERMDDTRAFKPYHMAFSSVNVI